MNNEEEVIDLTVPGSPGNTPHYSPSSYLNPTWRNYGPPPSPPRSPTMYSMSPRVVSFFGANNGLFDDSESDEEEGEEEEPDDSDNEEDSLELEDEQKVPLKPRILWNTSFEANEAETAGVAAAQKAVESYLEDVATPMCKLIAAEACATASKAVLNKLKRKNQHDEAEAVPEEEEEEWEI